MDRASVFGTEGYTFESCRGDISAAQSHLREGGFLKTSLAHFVVLTNYEVRPKGLTLMSATWKKAFDAFITSARVRYKPAYVVELNSCLSILVRWAEARPVALNEFTAGALDTYLVHRMASVGKRRLEIDARTAKLFFRFCRSAGLLSKDPLERYVVAKAPKAHVNVPDAAYLAKLLRAIEDRQNPKKNPKCAHLTAHKRRFLRNRDTAIVMGLISTGCRIGELCGLLLRDFDVKNMRATFRDTKINEPRTIPITAEWVEAVEEWLRIRPPVPGCETLFMSENGLPMLPNTVRQQWNRYEQYAGLPHYSRHSVRHFTVTAMVEKNPRTAQLLAGHKRIETTMGYDHTAIEKVRADLEAVQPLGRVLHEKQKKRPARVI